MNNEVIFDVIPEYVYLTVPTKYICTYHKLLNLVADFGITLINDCKAFCNPDNRKILECWSLFQSACAAYSLNMINKADFFIKYINEQIECTYSGTGINPYDGTTLVPIDENGHIFAYVSCSDCDIQFTTDFENARLFIEYNKEKYGKILYIDDDGHLKQK